MSKVNLSTITNGQNISLINDNFDKIADALNEGALWRDNPVGEPNQLLNDVDMNGNAILNVGGLEVDGQDIVELVDQAEAAAVSATSSAQSAATSASNAAATLANALIKSNNLSDLGNIVTAKTNLGLNNVDNTSDVNKPISTATQTALNLKLDSSTAASTYAPLASPTFTGDPKAPTPATADNDTSIATTAYVVAKQQAPSTIGSVTPNTGAFTTLNSSGIFTNTQGNVLIDAAAGTAKNFTMRTSGNNRWALTSDSGTESGSNAGSNFVLSRFNDAGTFIDSPIQITRSNGILVFPNGIAGRTNGTAPTVGNVGEILEVTGSAVSVTSNVILNVTSLSVTAGEWDLSGVILISPAATTVPNFYIASSSATSATHASFQYQAIDSSTAWTAGNAKTAQLPIHRIVTASTITIYAVLTCTFTTSTLTATGYLRARRVA